jgi:hypothetical protein
MTNICLPAVLFCVLALSARAAPLVVVADFDFVDSSGEARDQTALHAASLRALKADIIDEIGKSGKFGGSALACGQPVCSADSLDQDRIAAAARAQQAKYVVFGGVHKISTLIQFGQVGVMDVASGRSVLSRAITFRGDDRAAWQHASGFISQMLIGDLK